jgi:hypothetical protein
MRIFGAGCILLFLSVKRVLLVRCYACSGGRAVDDLVIHRWYHGQVIQVLDDPEITDQIHELIFEDRRISAKSIAEQLGISRERVWSIIHEDLDSWKLSAKWVPKCLNADQKRQRCQGSEQILEFFRRDPNDYLSRLVTMDETWLYHYDPEIKQQ